jgi:hypothetical protein
VSVVAPNGDEWHYLGEAVDLSWSASDNALVTSVDLRLSRDGGSSYEDIALGELNDGLYTWTATGPPTNQALLQVSAHDQAGNTGTDVSDVVWHVADVVSAPTQTVVEFVRSARCIPTIARRGRDHLRPAHAPARCIEVLDVQGRVLAVLVEGPAPAGRHIARWRLEPQRSPRGCSLRGPSLAGFSASASW